MKYIRSFLDNLSQAFFLVGISLIGFQIYQDPWMLERLTRAVRENCRIENRFLDHDFHEESFILQIKNFISLSLLVCIAGSYLKLKFMSQTLLLIWLASTFLIWNPNMILYDEKFQPVLFGIFSISVSMHIYEQYNQQQSIKE